MELYYLFIIVSIGLGLYYFYLLMGYRNTWINLPEYSSRSTQEEKVSIIVIARNEEQNIAACLNSIIANNYPSALYEIILVDDHSEDQTSEVARSLKISNLKILSLKDYVTTESTIISYKKHAHKVATQNAAGRILLFTDADVIVPEKWINNHVSALIESNLELVTGPIKYSSDDSILQNFQALDVAGTMLMTAAGISSRTAFLANGASMSVTADTYFRHNVNDKNHMASGDDVFLIQSITQENIQKAGFLKNKNTTVITYPEMSWSALLAQRLRWASKTTSYNNFRLTFQIAMIYVFNVLIFANVILGLFFDISYLGIAMMMLAIKFIVEIFLLSEAIAYFKLNINNATIPFYSILNSIYILVIGTMGLLRIKFNWKDRIVS